MHYISILPGLDGDGDPSMLRWVKKKLHNVQQGFAREGRQILIKCPNKLFARKTKKLHKNEKMSKYGLSPGFCARRAGPSPPVRRAADRPRPPPRSS